MKTCRVNRQAATAGNAAGRIAGRHRLNIVTEVENLRPEDLLQVLSPCSWTANIRTRRRGISSERGKGGTATGGSVRVGGCDPWEEEEDNQHWRWEYTYKPAFEYSIEEFLIHFDHFLRKGTSKEKLIHYFRAYYSNRFEGLYKVKRFGKAFDFMLRHIRDHDLEGFIVFGEQRRALVSKPFVVALALYFGSMPTEYLTEEADRQVILGLARMARQEGV